MKRKLFSKIRYNFLVFLLILIPNLLNAAVEYESLIQVDLDASILDVTTNSTADLIFVLTPGEVLILSAMDGKIVDHIPVEKKFERITYHHEDKLILTARNPSIINIIKYSRIYDIDLINRPFKGRSDAKVTLVVFDDYQ
ncbi:MAG: hypothetical protein GY702_13740 [Desulfobulbaceae bacterium]|nr:hypothetical protein [Desulfobulbaceae bacterium]